MRISVNDLLSLINELPKDVANAPERRIGKSVFYYSDSGDPDKSMRIDVYFCKSADKSHWQIEWPTVKSEAKSVFL